MLPGVYDLQLYRGDTARYSFVLWQDTNKTIPLDLTGSVAAAQVRDRADSGRIVIQLACSIGLPNTVNVALLAPDSAALPSNCRGVWDLQITAASGDVTTVVGGNVSVTSDVTRGAVGFLPAEPVQFGPVRVEYPVSGETIILLAGDYALHIANGPHAALTVRLPPSAPLGALVEISFAQPVASLSIEDAGGFAVPTGPASGYGPGAAVQLRYVDASIGWSYWK